MSDLKLQKILTGNDFLDIAADGYGTCLIHIGYDLPLNSNLGGGSILFKGLIFGTGYFDIYVTKLRTYESGLVQSTTVADVFAVPCSGFSRIRLQASSLVESINCAVRGAAGASIQYQIMAAQRVTGE